MDHEGPKYAMATTTTTTKVCCSLVIPATVLESLLDIKYYRWVFKTELMDKTLEVKKKKIAGML